MTETRKAKSNIKEVPPLGNGLAKDKLPDGVTKEDLTKAAAPEPKKLSDEFIPRVYAISRQKELAQSNLNAAQATMQAVLSEEKALVFEAALTDKIDPKLYAIGIVPGSNKPAWILKQQ